MTGSRHATAFEQQVTVFLLEMLMPVKEGGWAGGQATLTPLIEREREDDGTMHDGTTERRNHRTTNRQNDRTTDDCVFIRHFHVC